MKYLSKLTLEEVKLSGDSRRYGYSHRWSVNDQVGLMLQNFWLAEQFNMNYQIYKSILVMI